MTEAEPKVPARPDTREHRIDGKLSNLAQSGIKFGAGVDTDVLQKLEAHLAKHHIGGRE